MSRIPIGNIEKYPEGSVSAVEVENKRIALCNVNGELFGIDAVCSHAEELLHLGELDGNLLSCPRHGAKFDVKTGIPATLPAVIPVKTYPIEIENGEIFINTGD